MNYLMLLIIEIYLKIESKIFLFVCKDGLEHYHKFHGT